MIINPSQNLKNKFFESQNGVLVSWKELYDIATKLEQIIDITIIGCNDLKLVQRYDTEEEMYKSCDIVIEMVDGSCWEVFSKDENLINGLAAKFKSTQFLDIDFLNR